MSWSKQEINGSNDDGALVMHLSMTEPGWITAEI